MEQITPQEVLQAFGKIYCTLDADKTKMLHQMKVARIWGNLGAAFVWGDARS
jgi:hypothetical protein